MKRIIKHRSVPQAEPDATMEPVEGAQPVFKSINILPEYEKAYSKLYEAVSI